MKWIDANAMIGAHFEPREGQYPDAKMLLDAMDVFGVDQALVYHGLAREYDIMDGNRQLLKEVAKYERLLPCWIGGTNYDSNLPEAKELVEMALENRVAAFRFFFGAQLSDSRSVDLCLYGDLFRELEMSGFPVIISFEQDTSFTHGNILEMDPLISEFPDLPIIVSVPKLLGDIKMLYARMEKNKNIYLETSGMHGDQMIEKVAGHFGAEHVIYGSNFPWFGHAQSKMALAYSGINENEKKAVAGENLMKLVRSN